MPTSRHHPRKRVIQYSRAVGDRIEKPQRTGYPAGACHRARRRRDPVAGHDGYLWTIAHPRLVVPANAGSTWTGGPVAALSIERASLKPPLRQPFRNDIGQRLLV